MLRLLALCTLLLALPASAQEQHARMSLPIAAGSVATAAACTPTSKVTIGSEGAADITTGQYTTEDWLAVEYTPGANYTNVTRIGIWLKAVAADPSFTVTGYIWSNNATPDPDVPNAVLGTSSNTVSVSGTSYVEYAFNFATGVSLSSGTKYWFGISTSAANATNYIQWSRGSYSGSIYLHYSADGSTWTQKSGGYGYLRIYNCE